MQRTINTTTSSVKWTGKKVLGKHHGTIDFKEGHLAMEGDRITGGKFIVDMSSITVTDLEGENKAKLEGHLHSDDFFSTDKYSEATMEITSASQTGDVYSVQADLTIKGETHPVKFDLNLNGNTATTVFKVDRTKYGVRYGSGSFFDNLGDNTIRDNFDLEVDLQF